MARELDEFRERPHAVDANGFHGAERAFFGIDDQQFETHEIRVLAGDRITAAGAFAAGQPIRTRCFTQQRLGEIERQRMLADALGTVDQQRMRPGGAARQCRARSLVLPRQQR